MVVVVVVAAGKVDKQVLGTGTSIAFRHIGALLHIILTNKV
jgi:hypothetical protein